MTVTVDKYTRLVLTAIVILLSLLVVGMWHDLGGVATPAQARVLDSAQQTQMLIQEMEKVNASLADLKQLLQSGKVKVQIAEASPAKKTAVPSAPAAPTSK